MIKIITIFYKIWQDITFLIYIFLVKLKLLKSKKIDISIFEELSEYLKGFKDFDGFEKKIKLQRFDYPIFFKKALFFNIFKIKKEKITDIRKIKELEREDFFYLNFLEGALKNGDLEKFIQKKIDNFPFPEGYIWRDGLELSIWFLRFGLFLSNLKDKKDNYLEYLFFLGKSIGKNLSLFASKNNHYIGELSALFLFYTLLDEKKKIEKLRILIEKEFIRQFSEDGICLEGVNYQIEDLEWIFIYLFVQNRRNVKVGEDFKNVVLRAINFLDNYFSIPHNISIGDSDDGNILSPPFTIYGRYRFLKFLYSLFGEVEIKCLPLKSGYFIGNFKDFFIILKCGDIELKPDYTHSHADNGSFIIFYKSKPILVDSGTYCYRCERELRDYFRGSGAHNMFLLEGNHFFMERFFGFKKYLKGEINRVNYFCDFLEIELTLFLDGGKKIKRILDFYKNGFKIRNFVEGLKGESKCFRFYNFSRELFLSGSGNRYVVDLGTHRLNLIFQTGEVILKKGEEGKSYFSYRFFEKFDKPAIEIRDIIRDGEIITDDFLVVRNG